MNDTHDLFELLFGSAPLADLHIPDERIIDGVVYERESPESNVLKPVKKEERVDNSTCPTP